MQSIILGVFFTTEWFEVIRKTNSFDYPFSGLLGDFDVDYSQDNIVKRRVIPACKIADKINFLLDSIDLPLNSKASFTCMEMEYILSCPEILAKTQFWIEGEMVDKTLVLKAIEASKNMKLTFNNLNLSSFNEEKASRVLGRGIVL